jgi:hypothetical protein
VTHRVVAAPGNDMAGLEAAPVIEAARALLPAA